MHPAVIKFKQLVIENQDANTWLNATEKQKKIAMARKVFISELNSLLNNMSFSQAVKHLKSHMQRDNNSAPRINALALLKYKTPSTNTLKNWISAFEKDGLLGLLPQHKGSMRKNYGWESLALELYHRPQQPSMKKVARDLREDHGFDNATEHNVWYFLNQLPAELGDKSPYRMGTKLHRDSQRMFNLRHTENLKAGDLFQGDGHTLDVYLKHPSTGKLWRAELTVFQDWKSRYIVGWYISNAESAVTTMAALSHAMGTYNHVPLLLYIDNGCGYKSKLMNDDTAGFYASFGIDVIFAIPGNAKAKGNVERFFRVMEEDLNKNFDTYCGKDMSNDIARHFSSKKMHIMEKKGIHIPSLEEWCEAFEGWLNKYHNRPHPEYKNTTPAAMWAQLERIPVHDQNLLIKPREQVNVVRATINLHGRRYHMQHLHQFNGKKLVAEYDLHNDTSIRVFDLKGTYLLTANLTHKKAAIPTSRIEQQRIASLKSSEKRLQNKIEENRLRHSPTHSAHEQQLDALELIEDDAAQEILPEQGAPTFDLNELYRHSLLVDDPEDDTGDFDKFDVELID
ncbi:MAG: transposase [Pseudomonas sp.]|nr:transposase [Pseudomonas sp.]